MEYGFIKSFFVTELVRLKLRASLEKYFLEIFENKNQTLWTQKNVLPHHTRITKKSRWDNCCPLTINKEVFNPAFPQRNLLSHSGKLFCLKVQHWRQEVPQNSYRFSYTKTNYSHWRSKTKLISTLLTSSIMHCMFKKTPS